MRHIKGVLVDPYKNTIEKVTLDIDTYKDIYPLLDCSCFTVVSRLIGNIPYDIYCDEEALLTGVNAPAIVSTIGRATEVLYGKVFVCTHNRRGDMKSLTTDDFKKIFLYKCNFFNPIDGKTYQCLKCSL